tara:strand:- start:73 stop:543 length:471 start_codon:yes stop_codon:yes gene_type:complete
MGMFDPSNYEGSDEAIAPTEVTQSHHELKQIAERVENLALDVVVNRQRFKEAKTALDTVTAELCMALPPSFRESGERAFHTDKLTVTSVVSEKLAWDQEVMSNLYNEDVDAMPTCVKVSYAVTKARYESASDLDRAVLASALTRSASKPKIKIEAK